VKTLTKPADCNSKEEIRVQIDQVDRAIIELFALRNNYVQAIVQFKEADIESIIAKDRKEEVIRLRGEWAEQSGLNKNTFEHIFEFLIEHNIVEEMQIMEQLKK
jgi:isochorismate pyruvate lyase